MKKLFPPGEKSGQGKKEGVEVRLLKSGYSKSTAGNYIGMMEGLFINLAKIGIILSAAWIVSTIRV